MNPELIHALGWLFAGVLALVIFAGLVWSMQPKGKEETLMTIAAVLIDIFIALVLVGAIGLIMYLIMY